MRALIAGSVLLLASPALAQQPVGHIEGSVVCGVDGSGYLSVAQLNTFGAGSLYTPNHILLPHPGTVIACSATLYGVNSVAQAWVLYSDGEVCSYYNSTWTCIGNLFMNQPVQTVPATLGRVKAGYRP